MNTRRISCEGIRMFESAPVLAAWVMRHGREEKGAQRVRARGEALNGEYAYTCKSRVSLGHLMIPTLYPQATAM